MRLCDDAETPSGVSRVLRLVDLRSAPACRSDALLLRPRQSRRRRRRSLMVISTWILAAPFFLPLVTHGHR